MISTHPVAACRPSKEALTETEHASAGAAGVTQVAKVAAVTTTHNAAE